MIKREKYLNKLICGTKNGLIKVITGPRRSGKSFLLTTIFRDYLIDKGISDDQIIYFTFDNDLFLLKLEEYYPNEPTKIYIKPNEYVVNSKKFIAYILDQTRIKKEYYLLLDEIQLLQDFVPVLNGFLSVDNYDTYVTGSNSKFLSSDIETKFRGRDYQIRILPLSFREFAQGKEKPFDDLFLEYSTFGGLPALTNFSNNEDKGNYLSEVFQSSYLKDIVERNGILKNDDLNELILFLASNICSLTNPTKLENTFKSKKKTTYSSFTIGQHISYLLNAFLINECSRYDVKGKRYIGSNNKYYFTDLGIRNAVLNFRQDEPTHIMENAIYNELLYRGYRVDVGAVVKNVKENGVSKRLYYEADFVCNKLDSKIYVQSAYSIAEKDKYEQECKSLLNIKDSCRKIIITHDNVYTHENEDGILILRLDDFLNGYELQKSVNFVK